MATEIIKVLLLDANQDHIELIQQACNGKAKTFNFFTASTLMHARKLLKEITPDMIIIDPHLPDGDGLQLLPGSMEERSIPIIVLTSQGDEKTAVASIKAGALDYIIKSNEIFSDMLHIIERTLREWKLITDCKQSKKELERSERKQIEEALKNASELTSTIVSELNVGTAIYDPSGQCTLVNDEMARQTGATKDAMLAQNFNSIASWKNSGLLHHAKKALDQHSHQHLRTDFISTFGKAVVLDCHFVVFQSSGQKQLLLTTYDISKLRSYESALLESEERFRELFERNKSVELIVDPNSGAIIEANHAAEVFYGYSIAELLHLNISDLNTLSNEEIRLEMELARLEHRDQFIFKHRLANGNIKDVEVFSGPIYWNKQKALYSIIHDITAQKQSEYFTERTALVLKMVASGQPAGKVYDAICLMHEEKYPRMSTSILMLKGDQLFHCSSPSLPTSYSQAINGVKIGNNVGSCGTAAFLGVEVIVEDIATDPLWASFKDIALSHHLRACWSEPIIGSNGEIFGTFAMYFDQITKPTESELKEIRNASDLVSVVMDREHREARLRTLSRAIEQAGEAIVITNVKGVIEYINPSFSRMTGYTSEEALGKNPRILKSNHHEPSFYQELWSTITAGKVWQGSVVDVRKDGREYTAMMSIAPILDDTGQITHFVGIQQDMTEHELLESQLRQAQKMEALGTLVGGIAHDFNNMLAGITGNLYLAKIHTQALPEVVEKLDNAESIAFRAADMIQQLLTFARKDRVSIKQMALTPFIKETIKFLHTSVPENIAVHQQICSDDFSIKGDATRLHQALMNLMNNAQDAVAAVKNPSITIKLNPFCTNDLFLEKHSYFKKGAYALLSVEDNGCGIPEAEKIHLFEPFFSTKEEGKGTGLGLAMVFGAVKTHQGFIEVDSIEGEGAAFHIYLPLLESENTDSTNAQNKNNDIVHGHGEMILLVDDQLQVVETGKAVLESLGYQVITADNGERAVTLFEARVDEIDLVIMDVVMPVLGGNEAAQRMRQIRPQAKIILSTGYDKDIHADGEKEIVLSKPFSIQQISQLVQQQLQDK